MRGLPIVSAYSRRVRGPIARATASGSCGSTKRVVMPMRGNAIASWLCVPPYRFCDETISSPASSRVSIATAPAARPEAVASAPTPPSSEAMRSSNTAVVGLTMRV